MEESIICEYGVSEMNLDSSDQPYHVSINIGS